MSDKRLRSVVVIKRHFVLDQCVQRDLGNVISRWVAACRQADAVIEGTIMAKKRKKKSKATKSKKARRGVPAPKKGVKKAAKKTVKGKTKGKTAPELAPAPLIPPLPSASVARTFGLFKRKTEGQ